jgi:hypothetical protein
VVAGKEQKRPISAKFQLEADVDSLSTLYGWLTGTWRKQNSFGKALLSCALLLVMACVCGVPLMWLALFEP